MDEPDPFSGRFGLFPAGQAKFGVQAAQCIGLYLCQDQNVSGNIQQGGYRILRIQRTWSLPGPA